MVNTIDAKTGKLVRWESYERDRANLIVSKWENYYIVLNLGTQKKRSKKDSPVRQYKVSKDKAGNVTCTCKDFTENNTICKHALAVWMKAKVERQQQEAEREARVKAAIARW